MTRWFLRASMLAGALLIAQAADLAAQAEVIRPVEHLTFARPEAWAMKYFASTTLLNGLEMPDGRRPGTIIVGAEVGWLPRLTTAQQRVGFFGTSPEDLNKAPIFVR